MSFPESLATAVFVVLVAVLLVIAVARAGTSKENAHRDFLRDSTPPHKYINHDGTEGRWP